MSSKSGNGSDASKKHKNSNGSAAKPNGNGAALEAAEGSEKKSKAKLEFESMLTRDEAAAYFEAIVKGLRKGSIHFHQSDESLTLSPGEHVGIEVKATQKNGRQRLSFELNWRTDKGSKLTIVAGNASRSAASQ